MKTPTHAPLPIYHEAAQIIRAQDRAVPDRDETDPDYPACPW